MQRVIGQRVIALTSFRTGRAAFGHASTMTRPDRRAPPHVFVTDEAPGLRARIAQAVQSMGWSASELRDRFEMLALLEAPFARGAITFLVTDLRSPDFDAVEVLDILSRARHKLHTLVVTAFPDQRTPHAVGARGTTVFVIKPFDVDDLCTALLFLFTQSG